MLVIPFTISATEYSIFVILQEDNLDRMKAYDPAEVVVTKIAASSEIAKARLLHDVVIGYATDAEVKALISPGADIGVLLKNLSRGFRFRPEVGDSDDPYRKVR
jgi:hypothetical protein